jgi:staphylococcal nuclease domain-containing protein 1
LEGVDKFENLLGSVVLSGNKTFQEEILSQGLASIAEWNVGSTKFATALRKAEQDAKKKKLKLFKNYEAPKSSLEESDKKQQQALVVQVLSGDSLRVRYQDGTEERIFLSSISAPKFNKPVFKDKKDKKVESKEEKEEESKEEKKEEKTKTYYELFAFESKEFLRKKIAENNNLVTLKVDYKKTTQNDKKKDERKFATVTAGKKNVSFDLLQSGLASVSKHSNNEERSPVYDKLFKFDQMAKDQKKGRYETKEQKSATESYSLNDLTFSKDNIEESQKMFGLMKDRKTTAVVEKVLGGARLKLVLPKHNALVIFNISGISTNVGGSDKTKDEKQTKLTEESLVYTIKNIGNKDVEVLIERIDKVGNFSGQLFIGEENYSERILSEGLAYINHNIANRFKNYNDLVKAETKAKNEQKKFFSLSEEKLYGADTKSKKIEKEKVSKDVIPSHSSEPFSIRITEFVDASHFYLQTPEAAEGLEAIEKIFEEIKIEENNKSYSPNNGEVCICKFSQDGNWYRAKCISSNKEKDTFVVFYIDYGNKETTNSSSIRKIDDKLTKIPSLAKEGYLAYVNVHKDKYRNEALEYVNEFCEGNELLAKHEYTIGNRIFLTVLDGSSRKNLNSDLIRNGLAFFETRSEIISNNNFEKQVRLLSKDEEDAKKDRVYLWEDGDIYGSFSDDE